VAFVPVIYNSLVFGVATPRWTAFTVIADNRLAEIRSVCFREIEHRRCGRS